MPACRQGTAEAVVSSNAWSLVLGSRGHRCCLSPISHGCRETAVPRGRAVEDVVQQRTLLLLQRPQHPHPGAPGRTEPSCAPCLPLQPHVAAMNSCLEAASLAPWATRCQRGRATSLPLQTLQCWHRGPRARATTAPAGLAAQQQRARRCRLPALPALLLPRQAGARRGRSRPSSAIPAPQCTGKKKKKVVAFMTGQGHSLEFWDTNSGTAVLLGKAAIKPQPL